MSPQRIESLGNDLVKELRLQREHRDRVAPKSFLAEGADMIATALDCGWSPTLLLHDGSAEGQAIRDRCISEETAAAMREVITTPDVLSKVSGRDNPPKAIARFDEPHHDLAQINPDSSPRWLMLEGIRDPGNLGNCIRTAAAAGAGGIVLVGTCCDPYATETVRATTGAIFAIPIYRATLVEACELVSRWPGSSVAALPREATHYDDVQYLAPALLVVGSERDGLSRRLASACAERATIPMPGSVESLNVATAAALMLYASMRAAERSSKGSTQ